MENVRFYPSSIKTKVNITSLCVRSPDQLPITFNVILTPNGSSDEQKRIFEFEKRNIADRYVRETSQRRLYVTFHATPVESPNLFPTLVSRQNVKQ